MVNCCHCGLTTLPVMFVVIVVTIVTTNCLQLIAGEEIFDSSPGNDFRDNIHNGKFVIYDQIDRQMVESSMDEVMASGDDESFPFMTKVLPDYQHKDTQTIHTYMLPPEAEGHFNHHFDSPLQLDVNDKFGYQVNGNHQIQAERPFKQPGQRNLPFKTSESIQSPVFATNTLFSTTTTKPPLFKVRPKERPSLAPTSFIRHPDKMMNQHHHQQSGLPSITDHKSTDKIKVSPPAPTSFLSTVQITPAPTLLYPPSVSTSSSISSSSSIRAVHVPREDDKRQLVKTQKPKKYFPEPVKMTISPRFESLRLKSPEAQAQAANSKLTHTTASLPPQPVYSPRSVTVTSTPMPPPPPSAAIQPTPWRTNSRFPSWDNHHTGNGNNQQYHHHHHQPQNQPKHLNKHFDNGEDYIPGDRVPAQSTPPRYHVEGPSRFKPSHKNSFQTDHFKDLHNYEDTSASDEVGQSALMGSPSTLDLHHNTPTSTRIAVQNHPDLTDKQRDSLLKILESYYKLINQFNLDFRKLINESKGKGNKLKQNNTIVIEPKINVDPTSL